MFLAKAVVDATEDARIVAAAGGEESDSGAMPSLVVATPPSAAVYNLAEALARGERAGRDVIRAARQTAKWPATSSPGELPLVAAAGPQVKELLSGPEPAVRYPVLRHGKEDSPILADTKMGTILQAPVQLPVSEEVDVLVVGGGTSGAPAANAAARQRASVAVVDILPELAPNGLVGELRQL